MLIKRLYDTSPQLNWTICDTTVQWINSKRIRILCKIESSPMYIDFLRFSNKPWIKPKLVCLNLFQRIWNWRPPALTTLLLRHWFVGGGRSTALLVVALNIASELRRQAPALDSARISDFRNASADFANKSGQSRNIISLFRIYWSLLNRNINEKEAVSHID